MRGNPGRVVAGLTIMAIGLVLIADRAIDTDVRLTPRMWPLFLIILGTVRLSSAQRGPDGRPRGHYSGYWLLYLGCWGILNEFHVLGLDYRTSWPLVVIGGGLLIMWRSMAGPRPPRRDRNAVAEGGRGAESDWGSGRQEP